MSVSALSALTLDRCLREQRRRRPSSDLRGLSSRFQRRLARNNITPWLLATGEDFRWPTTAGGRPEALFGLAHRYVDQVLALIVKEPVVGQVFFEVLHLLRSPIALLQPCVLGRVLANVLYSALRRRRAIAGRNSVSSDY